MQYNEYVTKECDRWDTIAMLFYGDATKYEGIIAANPSVPLDPIIPANTVIRVPVLEDSQTVSSEEVPPWKR